MLRFIFHRALLMIPTLLGVAVLVFLLLRLMPGDPVQIMLEGANVSKHVIEAERARLGLDQPVWVQFYRWFAAILQGDFGVSMWTGRRHSLNRFLRVSQAFSTSRGKTKLLFLYFHKTINILLMHIMLACSVRMIWYGLRIVAYCCSSASMDIPYIRCLLVFSSIFRCDKNL